MHTPNNRYCSDAFAATTWSLLSYRLTSNYIITMRTYIRIIIYRSRTHSSETKPLTDTSQNQNCGLDFNFGRYVNNKQTMAQRKKKNVCANKTWNKLLSKKQIGMTNTTDFVSRCFSILSIDFVQVGVLLLFTHNYLGRNRWKKYFLPRPTFKPMKTVSDLTKVTINSIETI